MRSTTMAVGLAVPVLLATLTLVPAEAAPAEPGARAVAVRAVPETKVQVGKLRRGARPAVPWLATNVVHTPRGGKVQLPWGERAAVNRKLKLWDRTPAGWVVTDFEEGIAESVWAVKGDQKRLIDTVSTSNDERSWMVSRDGSALLGRGWAEGDPWFSATVSRLGDGATVDSEDFEGRGLVMDFTGQQALLGVAGDTVLWEPGGEVTQVGAVAVAGDVRYDVLMVPDPDTGRVGPTTITNPGEPEWTAPMELLEVSPDGRFALGLVPTDGGYGKQVRVRRLADGELIAAFHVRSLWPLTLQWETARSVIFMAERPGRADGNALVRCRLNGTCTRATAWRQLTSLPMVPAPQTAS